MGTYHALKSPSSADRWTDCTASTEAQKGKPNESSAASRTGTCGHQIGAECLEFGFEPESYVGQIMGFPEGASEDWLTAFPEGSEFVHTETVSEDLAGAVRTYVNLIRERVELTGGDLHVEQAVPIGHITGEEGATGSCDTGIIHGETVEIYDLKLGRAPVYASEVVEPESVDIMTGEAVPPKRRMNLQLAMYALGFVHKFDLYKKVKRVKATIVQPFLNKTSEYECDIEELLALGHWIGERAKAPPEYKPSNDNCWFCRARTDCPARAELALSTALDGFDEVETAKPKVFQMPELGTRYALLPLIRRWCDDVEAATFAEVEAGRSVIGRDGMPMKLVEGRKPAKAWDNPTEVEELLASWHLKDGAMWIKRVITPTEAAALAPKDTKRRKPTDTEEAPVIGPTRWKKLQERITQGEGKPTLALGSDPKPALAVSNDDMPDTPDADDLGDLFA
jgi:hypothetical protein